MGREGRTNRTRAGKRAPPARAAAVAAPAPVPVPVSAPEDEDPAHLSCAVCYELFRDPVTLLCGHTFCSRCVDVMWKSYGEGIFCPMCRAPVTTGKPAVSLALKDELQRRQPLKAPPSVVPPSVPPMPAERRPLHAYPTAAPFWANVRGEPTPTGWSVFSAAVWTAIVLVSVTLMPSAGRDLPCPPLDSTSFCLEGMCNVPGVPWLAACVAAPQCDKDVLPPTQALLMQEPFATIMSLQNPILQALGAYGAWVAFIAYPRLTLLHSAVLGSRWLANYSLVVGLVAPEMCTLIHLGYAMLDFGSWGPFGYGCAALLVVACALDMFDSWLGTIMCALQDIRALNGRRRAGDTIPTTNVFGLESALASLEVCRIRRILTFSYAMVFVLAAWCRLPQAAHSTGVVLAAALGACVLSSGGGRAMENDPVRELGEFFRAQVTTFGIMYCQVAVLQPCLVTMGALAPSFVPAFLLPLHSPSLSLGFALTCVMQVVTVVAAVVAVILPVRWAQPGLGLRLFGPVALLVLIYLQAVGMGMQARLETAVLALVWGAVESGFMLLDRFA